MKAMKKAVALALVIGTLGMTGSALAAPYRGAQIRRVTHLTRHIGRSHNVRKPGRSVAPVGRHTAPTCQNYKRKRPPMPTRRAPGRLWQRQFRMR